MLHLFSRNELAIGYSGIHILEKAHVAVVGIGGVGSFAAEALVRSGIGKITLIDKDIIDITNINRQLHANVDTIGLLKCDVMQQRMALINPDCQIRTHSTFLEQNNLSILFDDPIDFIVEAVDTIWVKSDIILTALENSVPIISSMGMANKIDPTKIEIVNIFDTTYDPIAKIIRRHLRKAGYGDTKLPVVSSTEVPVKAKQSVIEAIGDASSRIRKQMLPPASNAYVPSVAGLFCASHVVNTLIAQAGIIIDRKT